MTASKALGEAPAAASHIVSREAVKAKGRARGRLNTDKFQMWIGVVIIVLTTLVPDLLGNSYWTHNFQLINVFIIAAVFQNILMSDAGQSSFGQGAIFGVAAYSAAVATGLHAIPFAFSVIIGVLGAVVAGLIYAGTALRVQGYYLGFVTLSGAMMFPELLVALDKYTSATNGISISFPILRDRGFGVSPLSFAIAAAACGALFLHVWLRSTGFGRRLRVAAASPEAAKSLGINTAVMRCVAFLIVAAGTGVAGILYTPIVGYVSASAFNLELSIIFFLAVIVGGRGQVIGPMVGVWLLYLVPNILLVGLTNVRLLAYGAIALLVMLAFPDGLIGTLELWRQRRGMKNESLEIRLDHLLASAPGRADQAAKNDIALDVGGARKAFGAVIALGDVDMHVRRGEIHGLVGANGSGKTTLLNAFSGFIRLDAGSVTAAGADITRMPAHRIADTGIGRTFQTPKVFNSISIWENVEIGLDTRIGSARTLRPESVAALRTSLGELSVDLVPHGQRRLLEVMRVVVRGADILLLDEPAAGLSPTERDEFKLLLRRLRDELGTTIVLVEHDLDLVWGIADRITVLEAGKVVASGDPAEISHLPAVRSLFIEPQHASN